MAALALVAGCTTTTGIDTEGLGSSPDRVRVLAAFNTTGGLDWIDVPASNGLSLAADQLNLEGGVGGRQIEVVVVDGGGDEHILAQRVEQELSEGSFLAVTGLTDGIYAFAPRRLAVHRADGGLVSYGHSSVALAVGLAAEEAGVPVVAIGSSRPDLVLAQPGEELQSFVEDYEAASGEAPRNGFAAMGYDAMRLLAAAITHVDSLEPKAVGEALASLSTFSSLRGEVTYPADHRTPAGPITIVRMDDGLYSFVTQVAGS